MGSSSVNADCNEEEYFRHIVEDSSRVLEKDREEIFGDLYTVLASSLSERGYSSLLEYLRSQNLSSTNQFKS